MTIQEYKALVAEMRAAQKDYFKHRTKEALIKSKELESKVDAASIGTSEEVFEGFVKFYVQGNVAIPVRSPSRDEAIAHAERIVSACYGGLAHSFVDAWERAGK